MAMSLPPNRSLHAGAGLDMLQRPDRQPRYGTGNSSLDTALVTLLICLVLIPVLLRVKTWLRAISMAVGLRAGLTRSVNSGAFLSPVHTFSVSGCHLPGVRWGLGGPSLAGRDGL